MSDFKAVANEATGSFELMALKYATVIQGNMKVLDILKAEIDEARGKAWYHPEINLRVLLTRISKVFKDAVTEYRDEPAQDDPPDRPPGSPTAA